MDSFGHVYGGKKEKPVYQILITITLKDPLGMLKVFVLLQSLEEVFLKTYPQLTLITAFLLS